MSIIKLIDPEFDFWKLYPEFSNIEEFKQLKKDFKNSSDVMWFIVNCFDLNSKFINLTLDDRVEIVGKDYLGDPFFYQKNKLKLQSLIELYEKMNDTPIQRHMRQWTETLEKRTKFLRECEYDLDNFESLDKMAVGTEKLLATFEKIKKSLEVEKGEGTTKGNAIPSLADSEEI